MQSFKLFVVLIVTLSSAEHLTGATIIYIQWTSEKVYPRNVYQIPETLFDKLDSSDVKYRSERKLFKNLTIFDFKPICVQE